MFNLFKKPEPAKTETPAPAPTPETPKESWWDKLNKGLSKSSQQMSDGITGIFTKKKLDDATLEALEELLIKADMGVSTAHRITENLRKSRFGKDVTDTEVREALATDIAGILQPYTRALDFTTAKPFVLLMVGVNGVGKTTTLGKLAKQLVGQGKSVLMVAGDTFRAAAVQQLQVWAERTNVPLLAGNENADPAALAYKALEQAKADNTDVVLIDTAGRLHNKEGLMAELQKIIRVIKKFDANAPHATVLVVDATTGQNAVAQAETFMQASQVNGLILTKLDGSARGGILVALAEKTKIPLMAIGVGEGIDDLKAFEAADFAKALCGISKA